MHPTGDQTQMESARHSVAAWTKRELGRTFLSDYNLIETFLVEAFARYGFELRIFWNPKHFRFDAHWQKGGRTIKALGVTYSSDLADEARMKACAGLLLYTEDLTAHQVLASLLGEFEDASESPAVAA